MGLARTLAQRVTPMCCQTTTGDRDMRSRFEREFAIDPTGIIPA
jgi:hypothetical protein